MLRPSTLTDRQALFALGALTFLLLGVRAHAARVVGFGDSEALYVSYAFHPQAAYLDHPGLIGLVAKAIGATAGPHAAHSITTMIVSAVPWMMLWAARMAGADTTRAVFAAAIFALVPEICVGLFALTPDLILAPMWILSMGAVAFATNREEGSTQNAVALVVAGFAAGVGASAKVSGLLLLAALALFFATSKSYRRSPWAWGGIGLGLFVFFPVAEFEMRWGFPMLTHRFITTQAEAGASIRNAGAVFGGQLLYLSPLVAIVALIVARDLVRRRNDSEIDRFLFLATAVPFVPLLILSLWSRVAEPHWIAPALLPLVIHGARMTMNPRWAYAALVNAALFSIAVHAWVLVPSLLSLAPKSYNAQIDIANELYGWPQATQAIREEIDPLRNPHDSVVVLGPHWTVCAQLQAALGEGAHVGCASPSRDDFDDWLPRKTWQAADRILFVTDQRFPVDVEKMFPAHARTSQTHVTTLRGGRIVRVFTLTMIERRGAA